jgi:hypothetical protein
MFEKIKTWFTNEETKINPYLDWIIRKALWVTGIVVALHYITNIEPILQLCFIVILLLSIWIGSCDVGLYSITRLKLTDPSKSDYKIVIVSIIIGAALLILGGTWLYKDILTTPKTNAETQKIMNSLQIENEYLKTIVPDTLKK